MGKEKYARAAILRERVFTPYEIRVLKEVTGNARSLVDNQDYDVCVAMVDCLKQHPSIQKKLTPNDYNLLYQMGQGKYGGIQISERNFYLQKQKREQEQIAEKSLDAQVEKEQRMLALSRADIPKELWDEVLI